MKINSINYSNLTFKANTVNQNVAPANYPVENTVPANNDKKNNESLLSNFVSKLLEFLPDSADAEIGSAYVKAQIDQFYEDQAQKDGGKLNVVA